MSAPSRGAGGLRIGAPADAFEREADRVAYAVLAADGMRARWTFADVAVVPALRRKCDCGASGGECEECKAKKLQRKAETSVAAAAAPPIVESALRSPGRPMAPSARSFFESRFGADFSAVRIHADDLGDRSARAVGARAYTVGDHIVFKRGSYDLDSASGRRLLAHELAHVLQNSTSFLRRAPDAAALKDFDERVEKLKKLDAFKKLSPDRKTMALKIIKIIRARDDAIDNLTRLETLFNTPEQDPKQQAVEQEAEIEVAAESNTKRIEKQKAAGKPRDQIEEAKSAQKGRVFRKAKGRGGKTTFEIDDRDVTDIAIKVKLQLVSKSKGAEGAKAVANIKSLEDAIEKRASTWGYSVDLIFVDKPGPDVFSIPVDTGAWATAGNLAGDDATLAHELHHLLGLEEDRYDYRGHATTAGMPIKTRLYWFLQEFSKKVSNDPESIMDTNTRSPLDDDVCMVAGKSKQADIDSCVKERADARVKIIAPPLHHAADEASKTSDIVSDNAKLTSGLERAHIVIQLLGQHWGVDKTRKRLAAIAVKLQALLKTDLSKPANIRLVSLLIAGCEDDSPIAAEADLPVQLCPTFFEIGQVEQARALLLEAVHQAGIGAAGGDAPCKNQDCVTPCGDASSANTWVKFIECMAKT